MQRILTKRERLAFFITIGVIIFAVVFNFLLAPILTKNENLNKEINFLRTKLKKYQWLLAQKDYIQDQFSKFSKTYKVSEEQDPLVNALSELENLAKEANIRIIDLRPQATARNVSGYKEISIDLRTEGAMENYLKFIYHLENSLSLLKINKMQLSAKANTAVLEGSFSISQLSGLEK